MNQKRAIKQDRPDRVFPKKMKAIVEGVNFMKRSVRPTQENPSGGYVDREAPIHLSNLMAIHNEMATRVGYKKLEDGKTNPSIKNFFEKAKKFWKKS